MIGIIDYGAGNLSSVSFAFTRLGIDSKVITTPDTLSEFSHAVLPGVGSFSYASERLSNLGWFDAIKKHTAKSKPLLGICLGMQLLFDTGEEVCPSPGLGLISGSVTRLTGNASIKVPHVGWNELIYLKDHPVLDGIRRAGDFYFVHSYHCIVDDPASVIAQCHYGVNFPAIVAKNSVIGVQFHPEKSQPLGLRLLNNFSNWSGKC